MIAIGDVKWGNRIEPINIHQLSREELQSILKEHNMELDASVAYHIDTRLVSVFKADSQKIGEYLKACQYAFERKTNRGVKKPHSSEFSIFEKNVQITYELKHLKQWDTLTEEQKVEIYKHAKSTQNLFKMFGSNNVKIEMSLLDKAYFEVQNFLQAIKTRRNAPALPEGNTGVVKLQQVANNREGDYRKSLFDKEVQEATNRVSEQWQEQPMVAEEKKEREIV